MLLFVFIIFNFSIFFGNTQEGRYTIGVVGTNWYDIFTRKIIERNVENLVLLKEIKLNEKVIFYQSLNDNVDLINKEKINVLVGKTSLSIAQAAAHLNIPYFGTDTYTHPSQLFKYANMPHFYAVDITDEIYSKAIIELLYIFEVTKVAVVIDSSVNYEHFVRPFIDQKNITILIWTITNDDILDKGNLREKVDKILEYSRECNCWDFVVKADLHIVKTFISRAKYYGMLVRPNKWYLPSFICKDINIPAIRQIYSNITMINEQCSDSYLGQSSNYTMEAMINKVIQLFRMVKWKLNVLQFQEKLKSGSSRIFNEMGIQSQIKFTFHTLNVEDDQQGVLIFAGAWLYNKGKTEIRYMYGNNEIRPVASNVILKVAAVEEHPYFICKANDSISGFGFDLIKELSNLMKVNFTIIMFPSIGYREESGWTGVIRELITNRIDITLGPVVQSHEMEQVIDFSTSFKQREISLVMTSPSPSMSYFQFLQPFTWNVWLLCIISTVLLTFLTWGLERVHDKYFVNKLPVKLNFMESTWFTYGNVLKKQLDVFPNSCPALINNSSIFFFSLIIVTMYTANLAAFLIIQAYNNPIKEVEDLARLPPKSKITFGTVKDSLILEFFRESDIEVFQKIYHLMAVKNPHWLVNSTAEGYRRAFKEPYVFIWDDSVNQFEIFTEPEYDCKLISVGRPFGKRSVAIGLQQNSKYKEQINRNLLSLLETGKIDKLLEKWWKATSICGNQDTLSVDINPLSMSNVAGVFLIMVVGVIVAIVWFLTQLLIFYIKKTKLKKTRLEEKENNISNQDIPILPHSNGNNGAKEE